MVQAYNSTNHEGTGISPHFSMFGREQQREEILNKEHSRPWIQDENLTREVANNSRSKQGKYYDLKVRGIE